MCRTTAGSKKQLARSNFHLPPDDFANSNPSPIRKKHEMPDLATRFQAFMSLLPSVEIIDELALPVPGDRPVLADYLALGRSIVIEQKTITADQSRKIQAELDAHSGEDYYPLFYGTRDMNLVLQRFPDADEVRRRLYTQITRLLEADLSKADKQIRSTASVFGLENHFGVLLILNDQVKVLSPEIIARRIQQRLGERNPEGELRFPEISLAILISETHLYRGQFPATVLIEGPATSASTIVTEYLNYVVYAWAAFNGGTVLPVSEQDTFFDDLSETPEAVKERITRGEARRIWYRQNRYMEDWSDQQVLAAGARLSESIKPFVVKGGPKKSPEDLAEMMLTFGDFIEELNFRGLDLRAMRDLTSDQ